MGFRGDVKLANFKKRLSTKEKGLGVLGGVLLRDGIFMSLPGAGDGFGGGILAGSSCLILSMLIPVAGWDGLMGVVLFGSSIP